MHAVNPLVVHNSLFGVVEDSMCGKMYHGENTQKGGHYGIWFIFVALWHKIKSVQSVLTNLQRPPKFSVPTQL